MLELGGVWQNSSPGASGDGAPITPELLLAGKLEKGSKAAEKISGGCEGYSCCSGCCEECDQSDCGEAMMGLMVDWLGAGMEPG